MTEMLRMIDRAYRLVWHELWTVRDGRAVRMVLFTEVEKGFEAAGLRP
jgi:ketosteroid isomerase-like protein